MRSRASARSSSTTRSAAWSRRCIPNHTWEKVVFDPWRQETWDVNDTVADRDPNDRPRRRADFFARLPDADYLPTWHAAAATRGAARRRRAGGRRRRRAVHAATPTVAHARLARADRS